MTSYELGYEGMNVTEIRELYASLKHGMHVRRPTATAVEKLTSQLDKLIDELLHAYYIVSKHDTNVECLKEELGAIEIKTQVLENFIRSQAEHIEIPINFYEIIKKCNDFETMLEATDEKLDITTVKLRMTQKTLNESEAKLKATTLKLAKSEAKLEAVTSELDESKDMLLTTNNTVNRIGKKLENTTLKLNAIEVTLEDTRETLHDTWKRLDDTESKLEYKETELESTICRMNNAEAPLRAMTKKYCDAMKHIDPKHMSPDHKRAEEKLGVLQAQYDELKALYEISFAKEKKARTEVEAVHKVYDTFQEQYRQTFKEDERPRKRQKTQARTGTRGVWEIRGSAKPAAADTT